jgi:hypothetical protein
MHFIDLGIHPILPCIDAYLQYLNLNKFVNVYITFYRFSVQLTALGY